MKSLLKKLIVIFVFLFFLSCKKESDASPPNHSPVASLSFAILKADPITVSFAVTASDADNDPLSYVWDFGQGTSKNGSATETAVYEAGNIYTIKVELSDGHSSPVILTTSLNAEVAIVSIDETQQFQIMEGFGGFGAKDVYWSNGPFTSSEFVSTLMNDLGVTILRDNIPTNFEIVNDNNDPFNTDLSKFNLHNSTPGHDGNLGDHLQYLKDMKTAGLEKLIVSIWSAPPWMKTNNNISNGTTQNSAPAYNPNPTSANNQLRTDMYQEFAEMCVAYIKIIRRETGLDVYALSIQNEPRFSQSYASCVYNGEALRDLLKVAGKRLNDEGLTTKLFVPEDVGWFDGANDLIQPILADPEARQYVSFIATHGYAFDGVTASSTDAQTWNKMYGWGAPYNKQLWMTETSGFSNNFKGAVELAKAMYTAINFGNISAWLFWSISTSSLDEFSLMNTSGAKSKRFYVSKNFYRYIRPNTVRIKASAPGDAAIYPLAFKNNVENSQTIILINDHSTGRLIKLSGTGLPAQLNMYVTSEEDDCNDHGLVNSSDNILLPANSVITLYKKN
jgi:O-glycosyl hydrolase